MSHNPPLPDGAVSPYPLRAEAAADRLSARQDLAAQQASGAVVEESGHGVRIAVGAAIGSAAIAAALIYYNRRTTR